MIKRINLKCPACQQNLSGDSHTMIFFCLPCYRAYEIHQASVNQYSLEFIKPLIEKESPLYYFPFWRIQSRIQTGNPSPEHQLSNSRSFTIPAFFIKNIRVLGDIGYVYFYKNPTFIQDSAQEYPLIQAERPLVVAREFPYLYLIKSYSDSGKTAGPQLSVSHESISVQLIPFYLIDNAYYDSLLLFKYPASILI